MSTFDFSIDDTPSLRTYIAKTATRLKSLTQRSQQNYWHYCLHPYSEAAALNRQNWQNWPITALNERGHIAWPRGKQSLWLCQQFTVPEALDQFPIAGLTLRLGLTWWADTAKIYVEGTCAQTGDLFDCFTRLVLSDRATPGETFTVSLYLLSPGHDDGALVRSEVIYEAATTELPEPGFVADELTVLQRYTEALAPEKLADVATAIAPLDWSNMAHQEQFQQELTALRQRLRPLSNWIKQRRIACVGHAHLDLAWLWPVADTWQAAERTFQSVLSLQQSFPNLTYTHSSPALFAWLETHKPELFQQVSQAIKAGSWALDAGLWVEPEVHITGGESLARQILYGQRYAQAQFGQPSAIAWLPDSFGFSWQLPQLLSQGNIRYFATQKLRWNDTTTFPHSLFWWAGLDGTHILSLTLPPIGSDIQPELMARHGAEWEAQTGLLEMLWLPGMGDHGGGPTRDMLEKAQRWADSPFFPQLQFTSVVEHLEALSASVNSSRLTLPVWQDELYLELHRGCHTTHADQKWFNRRCEQALVEAEVFASLGQMQQVFDYPQIALEIAWKQVLFNQFHDILPGTAIPEVFETANQSWQAAYDTANSVLAEALRAIAHNRSLPPPPQANAIPLWVFNSLNWERTDLVEVALEQLPFKASTWGVFDPETGHWLSCQQSNYSDHPELPPGQPLPEPSRAPQLLFGAPVPSVGCRLFWLVPDPEPTASVPPAPIPPTSVPPSAATAWQLENDFLRAVINPATGDLAELWEKTTQTNIVRSPANQLQAFQDTGQYWDAWDIAPDYADHPLSPSQLKSITWLEKGPLRQRLRVVRQLGASTFQQDYVLDQHSPYLKVATLADWQASQVVLKVAFPLTIQSDQATFEIPFGAITRSTQSTDPHEQAKWEVPALRWADLSDEAAGLSLLTDYKHGFDTQPQQLRLTLLKAPIWPDPTADRGHHTFTYALYPHKGDWRQSKTPHQAISFNTPLRWVALPPATPPAIPAIPENPNIAQTGATPCSAPLQTSFLSLGAETVHLAALKRSEDATHDCDRYSLRCWDMYGQGATLEIATPWGTPVYQRTDLLETEIAIAPAEILAPWQIATLQLPSLIQQSFS